jgi:hypothetical protein
MERASLLTGLAGWLISGAVPHRVAKPGDPGRPHGLDIVRSLASDWGIDGDHTARTIWARFDAGSL